VTSDLQADLDELADTVSRMPTFSMYSNEVRQDTVDRLRNLLTDRNLDVPPLTSEIIAGLADPDHVLKAWRSDAAKWVVVIAPDSNIWRYRLAEHGDQRQHGYRLGVREPATERVRLDQVIGRTLPGETVTVRYLRWNDGAQRFEWCSVGGGWQPLSIAPDGTVEVLKDGSK